MAQDLPGISIGKLAKRTATTVQTLRYYETLGLMPPPTRTAGNQRVYSPAQAQRLSFIRHGRELGFPLDAIKELLRLSDEPDQSCATADAIAREQLKEVESRMARLAVLKAELERMISQCHTGVVSDCKVISILADHTHSNCISSEHDAGERLLPGRRHKDSEA